MVSERKFEIFKILFDKGILAVIILGIGFFANAALTRRSQEEVFATVVATEKMRSAIEIVRSAKGCIDALLNLVDALEQQLDPESGDYYVGILREREAKIKLMEADARLLLGEDVANALRVLDNHINEILMEFKGPFDIKTIKLRLPVLEDDYITLVKVTKKIWERLRL